MEEGMPHPKHNYKGNLIIKFDVQFPKVNWIGTGECPTQNTTTRGISSSSSTCNSPRRTGLEQGNCPNSKNSSLLVRNTPLLTSRRKCTSRKFPNAGRVDTDSTDITVTVDTMGASTRMGDTLNRNMMMMMDLNHRAS